MHPVLIYALTLLTVTTSTVLPRIYVPPMEATTKPDCYTGLNNGAYSVEDANAVNAVLDKQAAVGEWCCLPGSDGNNGYLDQGLSFCATTPNEKWIWILANAPGLQGKCISDAVLANYVAGMITACTPADGSTIGAHQAVSELPGLWVGLGAGVAPL